MWSGSGRVYYLRCNAIAKPTTDAEANIEIEVAASKFKDLAGNVNVASSAAADTTNAKFEVISDVVRPEVIITAAAADGDPATIDSGSFTNEAVTFTLKLVDQGAATLVPTDFPGCSNPDTTEGCWTTQTNGATGVATRQLVKQQSTNCAAGVFTVGAGSKLAPTLACTDMGGASSDSQQPVDSIAVASMDAAAGSITVASAESSIDANVGPGQILRIVPKRVGAVNAITGEPSTATMSAALTLASNHFASPYNVADYFNGWTIVTKNGVTGQAGKGVISDFDQSDGTIVVAWDEVITTDTDTKYTLLAPCSAAPLNTDLVIDTVTSSDTVYTFRSGQAPTARKTDATGQAGTANNPYGGIHGEDTDANFAIECQLTRYANDDIAITVPANAFADVALNGNVASRPQKGGGGVTYADAAALTIAPFLVGCAPPLAHVLWCPSFIANTCCR